MSSLKIEILGVLTAIKDQNWLKKKGKFADLIQSKTFLALLSCTHNTDCFMIYLFVFFT